MHQARLGSWSLVSLAVAAFTGSAHAEGAGALNRYAPAETPDDDFHLSRAADFGHERLGLQLHVDYASDPLVWESTLGDPSSERVVIGNQLSATLGAAYGLWNRAAFYAGLPTVLWMDGMSQAEAAPLGLVGADDSGLGDLYLGGRVRLLGEEHDIGALALQGTLTLPTSGITGSQHFRGSGGVTFTPELLGELRLGVSRLLLNVGTLLREDEAGPRNLELHPDLTFGIGFAVPLWTDRGQPETHVDLVVQSYGSTAFARFFEREQTPLQGSAGAHYSHAGGLRFGAAFGAGLLRGVGTPASRLIVSVGYAAPDAAPPEPVAAVDDDPCAEGRCAPVVPDSDGDGLLDPSDRCPQQPEDRDGVQDDDGCPELDGDGDGVADDEDDCPAQAGTVQERGCAPSDRDGDGIADRLDTCPDEPGSAADNGCAAPPQVLVSEQRIEIKEQVRFGRNSAEILADSYPLLQSVARVLAAHPEIARVRIEGHSDRRGSAAANLEISRRRAAAVAQFLVRKGGIAAERIEAEGYGFSRPLIPDATTPEQHEQNRRVEFHIVSAGAQGAER